MLSVKPEENKELYPPDDPPSIQQDLDLTMDYELYRKIKTSNGEAKIKEEQTEFVFEKKETTKAQIYRQRVNEYAQKKRKFNSVGYFKRS